MDQETFDRLVEEALSSIPEEFQDKLDNVELLIADWPTQEQLNRAGLGPGRTLLGLYQGVPHPQRGSGYNLIPPDIITLFRGPIAAVGRTRSGIAHIIRRTVLHEIAHHFGFDEEQLRELGY
ncbi:MAG: metallopeptidase family protein [Chloroflexota bacterium]|nr:metallopeptidase family protein [Chloroflexota bacterium]